MKIRTWIKYEESYLPPRCRKLRYKQCEDYVSIALAETSMNDLRLAFEDNSYCGKGKIYYLPAKKTLWTKATIRNICAGEEKDRYNTPLEALIWWNEHGSTYFMFASDREYYGRNTCRKEVIKMAQKDMREYLLVDGELYIESNIPFYSITTFGGGNNHGGTGLFVQYGKYDRKDFDALHGKEAVEEANKIASKRGDTKDVGKFKADIIVYMPELVKLN